MIDKENIESKDFSCVLPNIINKLQAIASIAIYNTEGEIDNLTYEDFSHGLGFIIQDAVDDLRLINSALY